MSIPVLLCRDESCDADAVEKALREVDSGVVTLRSDEITAWLGRHEARVIVVCTASADRGLYAQLRQTSTAPVLAVVESAEQHHALDAGANDVLPKPVDPRLLKARMRFVLGSSDLPPTSRPPQAYADFFERAADGILVVDIHGNVVFSNPRARALLGRTTLQLHGHSLRELLHPGDEDLAHQVTAGFAEGRYPQGIDFRIASSTGMLIASANFSMLREADSILLTFRDVTQERAMEQELRKTKSFLERVIESSVDAIVTADLRGNVLLFNHAAERCYGYSAAEVVGRMSVESLYPQGVARQVMRLIRERGGRLESYRTEVLTRRAEHVPVSISAGLIFEEGKPVGSVGIFTDLRERLRMESRLVAAQEELKVREKQAIVAELAGAAAHELNQPLTSVMGYAELLRRRLDVDSPAYSACEVIVSEAERMAEIVRKIGKITRYETKSYVGQAKILDLDKASHDDREGRSETEPPPDPLAPPSSRSGS
ncbi:MAG: PAS domain S-box protein [Polyangiaceae bacterium]